MMEVDIFTVLPWVLFGAMMFFALIFAIVAIRMSRRAEAEESRADLAEHRLTELKSRAESAERQNARLEARVVDAQARVTAAEAGAQAADERAQMAARSADVAIERERNALARAQEADASLRERQDEAASKEQEVHQRAEALLKWARKQWEDRREDDRRRAQTLEGFQAQLEKFLEYRRQPISFRATTTVDKRAAVLLERYASNEHVSFENDIVELRYPVDPGLGFRA